MRTIINFLLAFLFLQPIYAFPKDIVNDWEYSFQRYVPGKTVAWNPLEKLPLTNYDKEVDYSSGVAFISYKKKITFINEELQGLGRDMVSLHIPYVGNYYEIYWNQSLLRSCGRVGVNSLEEACVRWHLVIPLSRDDILLGENNLYIVTAGEQGMKIGLFPSRNDMMINLDRYSVHTHQLSERVTLMLAFLYFFMGLYHAIFYFKRPAESYNLYYSLFSIFLAIYIYTRTIAVFEVFGEGIGLKRTEFFVVYFIPAFLLFFLERFFLERLTIYSKIYFGIVSAIGVLTAVGPDNYMSQLLQIWQLTMPYVIIHSITVCVIAFRRGLPDIKRLIVGILALVIAGSWDVLGAMELFGLQNLGLTRYGFFLFVSGIAFILANRFLRVHKEVESLNLELEKKVEERTQKLQESLVEIQKLNVQQDGDYFLTSLLINPLSRNSIEDSISNYNIQFFSKQKKEFEFRGKKMEIGGDINIVERINLRNREYIVFVNGDAMGKSIQGAGGALVLGVIFHSVVVRTNQRKDAANKGPESWLNECYLELQTVFETFDGSMLISVVMGLIDIDSGFMFFINAEHPWTVLYRDDKAGFLERGLDLRKIGTMGIYSELSIKSLQLESGDVIYIGSDGRDDLLMGYTTKGERIINEDENLFLTCIEEGKGNLNRTIESILSKGEPTDDLSLIRIEFTPNSDVVITKNNLIQNRKKQLNSIAKAALKVKDYATASINFGLIADTFPDYLEAYYLASYSYKKNKDYKEALNYGERLYLRDSNHLKNLLNLADIHRYFGNIQRASFIIQRIEDINPNNPIAKKIRESLDKDLKEVLIHS